MNISAPLGLKTAVLLQYTGIGDLIFHLPYFKAVAAKSQDGRITLIAQPSTMARAVLSQEAWIERIIDHDHRPRRGEKRQGLHAGLRGMWRMAQLLKEAHFDRIVLFSPRLSRGLIAAMSGIPIRIGYGYHYLQRLCLNKPPYIKRHPGPNLALYHEATALAIAHGFCEHPIVPQMSPPEALVQQMRARFEHLPRPLYALAVGTSETHKQWGADKFVSLGRRLTSEGAGVLVIGGPAEAALAQQIARNIGEASAFLTDSTILGSAASLQMADACIGNDTGMVHVAAAVNTITHVLIGARPQFDHDPQLCMIAGKSLADISVNQVLASIQSRHPESKPR